MTRYNDPVLQEFEEELALNMQTLENNIAMLTDPEDRKFARSLCEWYKDKDHLSPKQLFRAMKFWQEVNSLGAQQAEPSRGNVVRLHSPQPKPKPEPAPRPIVQADGSKLVEMFDKAAEKLKYPHITFTRDDVPRTKIKFYRTGFQSKKPGTVLITDGVPYPNGTIFAQIMRDGTTVFGEKIWGNPEFQQLLKRLIEDPIQQFKINGQQFSNCCFCGRELTTKESLFAGYGPDCADNYGLPWGDVEPTPDFSLDI